MHFVCFTFLQPCTQQNCALAVLSLSLSLSLSISISISLSLSFSLFLSLFLSFSLFLSPSLSSFLSPFHTHTHNYALTQTTTHVLCVHFRCLKTCCILAATCASAPSLPPFRLEPRVLCQAWCLAQAQAQTHPWGSPPSRP